jgi:hypothetical protein
MTTLYRCRAGHFFTRPLFIRGHRGWSEGPGSKHCPHCPEPEGYRIEIVKGDGNAV